MAIAKVTGTFGATGQSDPVELIGPFNITLSGTFAATVKLERSFDAGVSWQVVSKNSNGDEAAYSAPIGIKLEEWERGVKYRLNCTAYTSGTVNYRLSQ